MVKTPIITKNTVNRKGELMKKWFSFTMIVMVMFMQIGCFGCRHEFSNWKTIKEATCINDGLRQRTCSLCGKIEEEVMPKSDSKHVFSDWRVVTKATCFETGEQERYCKVCRKVETEFIPKKDGDCGTQLSSYEMEKRAKEYVKDKTLFSTTGGGFLIYEYQFGSIEKGKDKDSKNIYEYYTVYGTYSYRGTDKYGQYQKGSQKFSYPVMVYKWSNNPDGYPEVKNVFNH